jgi:phosphohistidine phosphatase
MVVALLHHADALGPAVDFERPLSSRGRRQAEWLAARAREAGLRPQAIWHSGKRRARETAEAFLRACSPSAEFRMVRGLRSDDRPDWIRHELEAESRDVLLAGHMPHIASLLAALCPGSDAMPLHGVVVLERDGPDAWKELWRTAPPPDM